MHLAYTQSRHIVPRPLNWPAARSAVRGSGSRIGFAHPAVTTKGKQGIVYTVNAA